MKNFVYKRIRFINSLLRVAKLALRKLQDHLLFLAFVSSNVHHKTGKNEITLSLHFDDSN